MAAIVEALVDTRTGRVIVCKPPESTWSARERGAAGADPLRVVSIDAAVAPAYDVGMRLLRRRQGGEERPVESYPFDLPARRTAMTVDLDAVCDDLVGPDAVRIAEAAPANGEVL